MNETKCSLNFGLRAMRITNVARLNVEVNLNVWSDFHSSQKFPTFPVSNEAAFSRILEKEDKLSYPKFPLRLNFRNPRILRKKFRTICPLSQSFVIFDRMESAQDKQPCTTTQSSLREFGCFRKFTASIEGFAAS